MTWFLVITMLHYSGGGDVMLVPTSSSTVRVEMASREQCEQIKAINKFMNAECWAKAGGEK